MFYNRINRGSINQNIGKLLNTINTKRKTDKHIHKQGEDRSCNKELKGFSFSFFTPESKVALMYQRSMQESACFQSIIAQVLVTAPPPPPTHTHSGWLETN